MKNTLFIKIAILVFICLLATPIATFISGHISITTAEYEISRISDYSASIRFACLILSMYFICGRESK
nr:hypothetical protein [uncultured Mediterraneibacter sp.]